MSNSWSFIAKIWKKRIRNLKRLMKN